MNTSDIPRAPKSKHGKAYVMHIPVISTSHVHPSDRPALKRYGFPMFVDEGVAIHVDNIFEGTGFSDPMLKLARILSDKGYDFVRFDGIGDEYDDLPKFE